MEGAARRAGDGPQALTWGAIEKSAAAWRFIGNIDLDGYRLPFTHEPDVPVEQPRFDLERLILRDDSHQWFCRRHDALRCLLTAVACAASYDETGGAQLENLVACSLLKYTRFRKDAAGESWGLLYLRDKEGREVDFVVTLPFDTNA